MTHRPQDASAMTGAPSPLIRDAGGEVDLCKLSVLVIDDNRFIRSLVVNMFRAFGVNSIMDTDDAADAFRVLRHRTFDLIICDYLMSPLSGIDFIRLIRTASDSRYRQVPIILLTGHTEYEVIAAARDAGVTELLAKPISPVTLLNRVIYVFDNPRHFIQSPTYVGPDPRRKSIEWNGEERRGKKGREKQRIKSAEGVEIEPGWGLTPKEVSGLLGSLDPK